MLFIPIIHHNVVILSFPIFISCLFLQEHVYASVTYHNVLSQREFALLAPGSAFVQIHTIQQTQKKRAKDCSPQGFTRKAEEKHLSEKPPYKVTPSVDPSIWINLFKAVHRVYLTHSSSTCQLATGFNLNIMYS